jgi:hypothetical protein
MHQDELREIQMHLHVNRQQQPMDTIECPSCRKRVIPHLWHRPFLGRFRYLRTQHICRLCGYLLSTPVTNKAIFAFGLRPHRSQPPNRPLYHHKSREIILRHLLPVPVDPVETDKLLSFKRRHGHLLPPLRASSRITA